MKAETIHSLLDSNLTVKGFYYKGELLPNKLSKSFKTYIEKSFVRHNFTINQRDYLFTNVTTLTLVGSSFFFKKLPMPAF